MLHVVFKVLENFISNFFLYFLEEGVRRVFWNCFSTRDIFNKEEERMWFLDVMTNFKRGSWIF
jgi:hypothetical protein